MPPPLSITALMAGGGTTKTTGGRLSLAEATTMVTVGQPPPVPPPPSLLLHNGTTALTAGSTTTTRTSSTATVSSGGGVDGGGNPHGLSPTLSWETRRQGGGGYHTGGVDPGVVHHSAATMVMGMIPALASTHAEGPTTTPFTTKFHHLHPSQVLHAAQHASAAAVTERRNCRSSSTFAEGGIAAAATQLAMEELGQGSLSIYSTRRRIRGCTSTGTTTSTTAKAGLPPIPPQSFPECGGGGGRKKRPLVPEEEEEDSNNETVKV